MGERLLCKQEVVGSIPSGSTNFMLRATATPKRVGEGAGVTKKGLSEEMKVLQRSRRGRLPCLLTS